MKNEKLYSNNQYLTLPIVYDNPYSENYKPKKVIQENSSQNIRFNIMPDRYVDERIDVKEYRIWDNAIEVLFNRDYRNPVWVYCVMTTSVFLIVLFIPFFATTLSIFIGANKLDRMMWNIPFPLIFGVGIVNAMPYIKEKVTYVSSSKFVRTIIFIMLVGLSTIFFTTRKTYYGLKKLKINKQQISINEIELYNYLNSLSLPKGTHIWTPGMVGEYLPGFVYGVYPFSFRGEFDNRLEIPKGMERIGTKRPDYLFYSELNGEDIKDIIVECSALLERYKPDCVVISRDIKGSLGFFNDLGYRKDKFENYRYILYWKQFDS